jgi:hypothetical protein
MWLLWGWVSTRSMDEFMEKTETERVSCVAGKPSPGQAFLLHTSLLAYIPCSGQKVATHGALSIVTLISLPYQQVQIHVASLFSSHA